MNTNKKKYGTPNVDIILVRLEMEIAVSSATISGGVNGSDFTPDVEDWGEEEDGGYVSGDL